MTPTAEEPQVDPVKSTWALEGHKIVSLAAEGRKQRQAEQDDGGASNGVKLEAEHKRLVAEAKKIPESYGGRTVFLARLTAIEKDISGGGQADALALKLATIEGQIAQVLTAKPRSQSEEEDHKKWLAATYVPKEKQFATECQALTGKLLAAARKRAADDSLGFEFISEAVIQTRLAFEQELLLEGSGDGAATLKQFQSELAGVEKALTTRINSGGFAKLVEDEVDAAKLKAAQQKEKAERDEFEAAAKQAQSALAELEDLGNDQSAAFRKELEAAKDKGQAADIQGRIKKAIEEHTAKSDTVVKAHEESVEKIAASVESIAKKLDNKDAKKAVQTLKEELERTKALAKTGNQAAAEAADRMSKQIEALAAAAADKNSAFSKLFAGVKGQQDVLDGEPVKEYFAAEQKELSEALTKLSAAVDPMELSAAEKDFDGLKVKVAALTAKAEKLTKWQEKMAFEMTTLKRLLQEFSNTLEDRNNALTKMMGGLYDKLLGDETKISLLIKEVEQGYKKPGVDMAKVDVLWADLQKRVMALNDIWRATLKTGNPDALQGAFDVEAAEAKAELDGKKKAEADKKKEREEWDKEYEAFEGQVAALKKLVTKNKGPDDEVATIVSLAEAGNKMAENGDVAGARDKLKLAEARREELSKAPGGVTMRSAAELAEAPKKWDEALKALVKKLGELETALDKETELSEKSRSAAKVKIAAIPALFNKDVFTADIARITTSEDPAVRKQAREKILKQVRQYRALMEANAILQLVRRNPFEVKQVTKLVKDCLASIELNTLRAIRAD